MEGRRKRRREERRSRRQMGGCGVTRGKKAKGPELEGRQRSWQGCWSHVRSSAAELAVASNAAGREAAPRAKLLRWQPARGWLALHLKTDHLKTDRQFKGQRRPAAHGCMGSAQLYLLSLHAPRPPLPAVHAAPLPSRLSAPPCRLEALLRDAPLRGRARGDLRSLPLSLSLPPSPFHLFPPPIPPLSATLP